MGVRPTGDGQTASIEGGTLSIVGPGTHWDGTRVPYAQTASAAVPWRANPKVRPGDRMPAKLVLTADRASLAGASTLLLVGRRDQLLAQTVPGVPHRLWVAMIKQNDPGDTGRTVVTHAEGTPGKIVAGILPEACARHNTPSRALAIPGLVTSAGLRGNVGIVVCLDDPAHAFASALAVARAHPTFSAVSSSIEREVRLVLVGPDGRAIEPVAPLQIACDAVRFAGDLVDQPPDRLTPTAFVDVARRVAERHPGVGCWVAQGRQLEELGLGGIWGVGKASDHPPALVVLDLDRPGPKVAWIGKGIVYDTGGLSIKAKTSMPTMKTDMAGAAAVLAAFEAVAALGAPIRLTAALCIAENAVGPSALRPDDILTLYSGKTVEVNNTDAEGRLVLADGVAWVARNRSPDTIVDLATLTGAQSISVGKRTAAIYCNDDALEGDAVRAGRASGDLVHPLPYQPELFRREFSSPVADMRNSVKDRNNAQSSCAAQFIGNHLDAVTTTARWLHVDMAGPATSGDRGTGYGVGLLLTLAGLGAPIP